MEVLTFEIFINKQYYFGKQTHKCFSKQTLKYFCHKPYYYQSKTMKTIFKILILIFEEDQIEFNSDNLCFISINVN